MFAVLALLLCGDAAAAPRAVPTVTLREVDPVGKITDLPATPTVQWVWAEWPEETGKNPFIPIEPLMQFPTAQFTIQTATRPTPLPRKGETRIADTNSSSMRVEAREQNGTLEFMEESKDGTEKKRSMIFTVAGTTPQILVDSSCTERGIILDSKGDDDITLLKLPYVGISCATGSERSLDVIVHLPRGARVEFTELGPAITEGKSWKRYRMPAPLGGWEKSLLVGAIQVADVGNQKAALTLLFEPTRITTPRRFSASLGLRSTFMSYAEQPLNVRLLQLPLTIEGALQFQLIPSALEAHIGSYFNIVNLAKSPKERPDVRFLGINARADYLLPFRSSFRMKIGLGWYAWTMLMQNPTFGIEHLTGPEAVLGASVAIGKRRLGGSFKFAPISASPSQLGFKNYELAGGLFVQLTSNATWPAVLLNADASMLRIDDIEGATNRIQLYTVSLGPTVVF